MQALPGTRANPFENRHPPSVTTHVPPNRPSKYPFHRGSWKHL
ncbi:hypothetical protein QFZ49_002426 [Streptomyces turgidiscabies]|uniref:Uncharacterized protein n=1 Tax=Streptomyces turgidiscabies TaxID=85558 RepID=A0ABU0RKH7_9ACTN|nr:hypothetical protein [Streptomyces turgidiscabies]